MYLFEKEIFPLDHSKLRIPCYCINAHDFYRRLYPFMENDSRLEHFFGSLDVYRLLYRIILKDGIKSHCIQLYIKD